MPELNAKLQQLLDFLETFMANNGYAPSIRDIAQGLHIASFTTVKQRLDALVELGHIERVAGYARGIKLVKPLRAQLMSDALHIPLLGRVSAGQPILAQEECESVLALPSEIVGNGEFFALRVKGDSMIEAGIQEGDVVVIRQQDSAENSDIVAALIGEEATIKRFFRETDHIRLQPENPAYSPIKVIDPIILGKAVSVVKKLVN